MLKRKLGQGLEVSSLGLGCMTMVGKDREEMIHLLREAVKLGVNFFDTAEIYGPYLDEELVGEALAPVRDQVIIATKCGLRMEDGKQVVDGNLEGIKKSLEGSLKRLKTNYIDLYYLHRVDPNVPIEDIAYLMKDFIKQGKIKHWGLSEAGIESMNLISTNDDNIDAEYAAEINEWESKPILTRAASTVSRVEYGQQWRIYRKSDNATMVQWVLRGLFLYNG